MSIGVSLRLLQTLVKARFVLFENAPCRDAAQIVLNPRDLAMTKSGWEHCWQKINQYRVPELPKILMIGHTRGTSSLPSMTDRSSSPMRLTVPAKS